MTAQPVPGVALKTVKANNIHMRYAEAGSGPLVLFCHGWPESWYSWRHQLTALSAAGFRCVAPDMRGYGGTEAPEPIDQYTLNHLVGDMAELVKALGETKSVIVGHDWGAPVAWHAALWRPDLFPAVCAMSVPYAPPGHVDMLTALEKLGINDFYLQYFQKPGVRRGRAAAGYPRRPAPPLFHRRRRAQRKGQGLRQAVRRHLAGQHRRSDDAAARG